MYTEKLKKYQREKFENYKLVNEITINDNEAYIYVKVDSLEDIISKFSINNFEVLNPEFANFISERASLIQFDYPLVIEIFNSSFSPADKITVRKVIKNHFTLKAINIETELKALIRKSRIFLMMGLLLFALIYFLFSLNTPAGLKETLSFIASFSIWQWAELVLFEQDSLKEELIKNKHLSKMRIIYNKENTNTQNI